MKPILGLSVSALLLVVMLVYMAKPNIPKVIGVPDYDAGIDCLREVPIKYDRQFFTFKAWVKSWYAHHADKWGVKMSPSLLSYYNRYIELQLDVDCYVQFSNDPGLNMTLSPIEFKAIYNVIAEHHGLDNIQ